MLQRLPWLIILVCLLRETHGVNKDDVSSSTHNTNEAPEGEGHSPMQPAHEGIAKEAEEEPTIFSLHEDFSVRMLAALLCMLILITVLYELVTEWLREHVFKEGSELPCLLLLRDANDNKRLQAFCMCWQLQRSSCTKW